MKRFRYVWEWGCELQTIVTQVVRIIRIRIKLRVLFSVMVLQVYSDKGNWKELNLEIQVYDTMFCVSMGFEQNSIHNLFSCIKQIILQLSISMLFFIFKHEVVTILKFTLFTVCIDRHFSSVNNVRCLPSLMDNKKFKSSYRFETTKMWFIKFKSLCTFIKSG